MAAVFQALSKSLKSAKGKLYAVKCDVSKESDVQAAFKWAKTKLGGVDILVNNAAMGKDAPLTNKYPQEQRVIQTSVSDWNAVFWDITPCGPCNNRLFGGTYRLHHRSDKNRRVGTMLAVITNLYMLSRAT
jgi:NAD(P)-dependent dehydrogenase (short-subunit alcohol dehydrogenase family)